MAKNKQRLDDYLVSEGYYLSKNDVARSALAKEIKIDTTYVSSPATILELDENNIPKQEISIKNKKQFVSRGALKLKHAITSFNIDVAGKKCLDIGSSTGGFTDCLLQAGASEVTCVDVNYGQLAWRLREASNVKVFERLNIRNANPDEIGAPFNVIVTDVSFISLASLSDKVASFSKPETIFIGLIKPQFECKKHENIDGVVIDESVRMRTIEEVKSAFKQSGFKIIADAESPIKGPAGNTEYLLYAFYLNE